MNNELNNILDVKQKQQNIIEVKDLTKKYGDFTAVDGISFEVRSGETFGILGPNGGDYDTGREVTPEALIEAMREVDFQGRRYAARRSNCASTSRR